MASRRDFIKMGCAGCLGLVGISMLQSCGTAAPVFKATTTGNKTLQVPLSEFTAEKNMVLVRNAALENDILLVKKDGGYKALYMQCTHQDLPLTATAKKIYCNAHGSVFDFDGKVVKEPALRPLKQFTTETTKTDIIIHLI